MKATVVGIESKKRFDTKHRVIVLKLNGEFIRVNEPDLGIVGLSLDDELEVSFFVVRNEAFVSLDKEKTKQ